MEKNLLFSVIVALLIGGAFAVKTCYFHRNNDLFMANVEALSDGESFVQGKCKEVENSCIPICSHGGAVYGAVGNHKGGFHEMSVKCIACENEF